MAEHLLPLQVALQVGCVCFSSCKEYQSAAAFLRQSLCSCGQHYAVNEGENAR